MIKTDQKSAVMKIQIHSKRIQAGMCGALVIVLAIISKPVIGPIYVMWIVTGIALIITAAISTADHNNEGQKCQ